MADSQTQVAETPEAKSFGQRFVGVFVSPGETLGDIVRKPDFVAPLIVLMLSTVVVSEAMISKIGMEQIVRKSIEHSGRASSMSPEQVQQAVEQGARIGGFFAHTGFLWVVGILLFWALVGWAAVRVIFGQQTSFKTVFSVTCYADLVSVLGAVMAVVLIFFGDPEHFNPDTPVPSNVGFFLNPSETSRPLFALVSSVDLFWLWFFALLGIGLSEAAERKVKPLAAFLSVLGVWIVWTLIKMGLASLG